MNHPLRLLLIDDNPDDRSLVIRELRGEWPDLSVEQAYDTATFGQALNGDAFDLVITDYHLRWTDGITLLKRIKDQWKDCPVVMFTGTGSEEIAVEGMKLGLDDYILKSPKHFARLTSAVRMALKLARQKRELRDAESKYGNLFDAVPIGLYRMAPSGELLDVNPALIAMLGYPDRETLLAVNAIELHADAREFRRWRNELERDGFIKLFETRLRRLDGSTCWIENLGKAVRDTDTGSICYEGSIENITERKESEVEREDLIVQLQQSLAKVKALTGLLPICASCKKIRDDQGCWNQIEIYIQQHSEAEFTHSFCPECMRDLYPEVFALPGTKFK
jgi:PAS domain S-box-containing protein